ncbi:MAG: Fur family transcriptional regulator [Pseudomonadota bacterium]
MTTGSTPSLTKNQSLVYGALDRADGPLTAYTILDQLRDEGLRAPPQVYRSLERLINLGMVHRLETLNAFVACRHPSCEDHAHAVFMICEACDHVAEIGDSPLTKSLNRVARGYDFQLSKAVVELHGTCAACVAPSDGSKDKK